MTQQSPNKERLDVWPAAGPPLIIGIAGGSGSGKTTISSALIEVLGPEHVAYLPHDAYYRDLAHLPFEARRKINFDHPDSLETELLAEHLRALRRGEAVEVPVYDFTRHARLKETVPLQPRHVILLEGILILAEEELRNLMDLKIYVDTAADLRLIRRLERDLRDRGRTVDSVLAQYEATVRPMHVEFVEPSKRHADLIIPEGYNEGAVGTVASMIRAVIGQRNPTNT